MLLEAKTTCLKAHLQCFLWCKLVEDFVITRRDSQFLLKSPDSSPQVLFKRELLRILDTLANTSEASSSQKLTLIAELESEADVQRAILWHNLVITKENEGDLKMLFSKRLFRDVILSSMTELGLLINYFQSYFGIKLKAGLRKSINNDKYHFMIHPSNRNLDTEDAFGPLLTLHETLGIRTYGEMALESVRSSNYEASVLDKELLSLEHFSNYIVNISHGTSSVINLLTVKSVAELLDPRSNNFGKNWVEKALSLAINGPSYVLLTQNIC